MSRSPEGETPDGKPTAWLCWECSAVNAWTEKRCIGCDGKRLNNCKDELYPRAAPPSTPDGVDGFTRVAMEVAKANGRKFITRDERHAIQSLGVIPIGHSTGGSEEP